MDGEGIVDDQGQKSGTSDDVLDLESVEARIVGGLELDLHQEDNVEGRCDEEHLHDGVVERDIGRKQISVSRQKDRRVQRLRLERNSYRVR